MRNVNRYCEPTIEVFNSEHMQIVGNEDKNEDATGGNHSANKAIHQQHVADRSGFVLVAFVKPVVTYDFASHFDSGRDEAHCFLGPGHPHLIPESKEANRRKSENQDIAENENSIDSAVRQEQVKIDYLCRQEFKLTGRRGGGEHEYAGQ